MGAAVLLAWSGAETRLSAKPFEGKLYATPARAPDFVGLEFARTDGIPLSLDVFLPPSPPKTPPPVVVLIHGGGWRIGTRELSHHLAQRLSDAGFAAVAIDYRLTDRGCFPAQLHDCKAAVRWVRANAQKYRWDPARVAAFGDSSGAHLALLLGTTNGLVAKASGDERIVFADGGDDGPGFGSRVQAVVDFFGYADFTPYVRGELKEPRSIPLFLGAPAAKVPERAKLASPLFYVGASTPPVFVAQGEADTEMLRQSEALVGALAGAKVPYGYFRILGAGHGDDRFYDAEPVTAAIAFLRTVLREP